MHLHHRKGFLSIQFIIGLGFFMIVLIFAVMILVVYSLKYFDSLSLREKHLESAMFFDRFYFLIYDGESINTSFYNTILNCESLGLVYDPSVGEYNTYYQEIATLTNQYLFLRYRIERHQFALFLTGKKYNTTSFKGFFRGNEEIRIERSREKENYEFLYYGGEYYKIGDIVSIDGKDFKVEYIDPLGKSAILKHPPVGAKVCGPSIPAYRDVLSFDIFVNNNHFLERFRIFVW